MGQQLLLREPRFHRNCARGPRRRFFHGSSTIFGAVFSRKTVDVFRLARLVWTIPRFRDTLPPCSMCNSARTMVFLPACCSYETMSLLRPQRIVPSRFGSCPREDCPTTPRTPRRTRTSPFVMRPLNFRSRFVLFLTFRSPLLLLLVTSVALVRSMIC